ncbi:two-component response regulator [Lysinibacillus capsici]|nr:two-component response regulator [Lysinibacillus capsici]
MARILVVDDEEILRMLIRETLEDLEFDIDEAEDGEEALKK